MKTKLYISMACLFFGITHAQVGIGTVTPNAQLEIASTNQATPANTDGILIPKIDEFPVTPPTAAQDGMLVYATGSGTPTKGFYYWDNTSSSWTPFITGTSPEWIDNGTYLSPIDGNTEDVTIGGTDNVNAKLTVTSNKSISGLFTNTTVQTGDMIGVKTILNNSSTSATSNTVGNHNEIVNNGLGSTTGNFNDLIITGTGSGIIQGVFNRLNSNTNGNLVGMNNYIIGTGTGQQYGLTNYLSGSGSGVQIAAYNYIFNSGNGFHLGVHNALNGSGTNTHWGVVNDLYGIGSGNQIGVRNYITNTSDGQHIGVENVINNNGNGIHTGIKNELSGSGNSIHYGTINFLNGSGSGNKYCSYNLIQNTAGGTHYGVYSSVLKPGSYAGYFSGRVLIGNGVSNYIMPLTRGTNGQIIKTDGTGNLYWANEVSEDHDFYAVGTTLPPSSINDNMFTSGNLGINNNNPAYSLDVYNGRGTRAINIEIDDATSPATVTDSYAVKTTINNTTGSLSIGASYGIENSVTVINEGYGVKNSITGHLASTGNTYGIYNDLSNNGSGNSYGSYNVINNTVGSGSQYASYNLVNGVGTGVYSQATDIGGVAGYFLGDVSIGTTSGNIYTLPASRGTNGQIIKTNGSGVLIWADESSDHDFYEVGSSTSPGTITDDIYTQGNLGIGVTNPQERLDVNGNIKITTTATNAAIIKNDDNFIHSSDSNLDFGDDIDSWTLSSQEGTNETSGIHGDRDFVTIWSPGDSNRMLRLIDEDAWGDNDGNPYNNAAEIAYVDATGQYFQASDKNRKENIVGIKNAIDKVSQINGYTYNFKINSTENYKNDSSENTSGVLAQELINIFPEVVQVNENGEYFVHYAGIIPLLIEGMKEQQEEIEALKQELDYLKQLEQRVKVLEQSTDN